MDPVIRRSQSMFEKQGRYSRKEDASYVLDEPPKEGASPLITVREEAAVEA